MLTIKAILMRNFELTKKFMIEKNAKLEMIHKMKLRSKDGAKAKKRDEAEESQGKKKSKWNLFKGKNKGKESKEDD